MSILIKGVEMPKEGFIELLVRDCGVVQQTGKSYRIDGRDYYTPYVGEFPVVYHAENVQQLGKWIPVTERLPESGVPTLICEDGNVVEQGFFDDEYGYWYDCVGNRTFVHHWMPLPEPPKGEKE